MLKVMDNSPNKPTLLSGKQLVAQSRRIEDFVLVSRGNKLTTLEDVDEQTANKQEESMRNLTELLNFERVLIASKIVQGNFEQDKLRIKLLNFSGRFDLGYFEDNVNYLRPHEALHLMEMSRLQVLFDTVVMSIEQAYAVFLNSDSDISFEEYIVFSYLSRSGYHVVCHDSNNDWDMQRTFEGRVFEDIRDKMLWCVLMERLNQPVPESFINGASELYDETQQTLDELNERICGKRNDDTDDCTENIKGDEPSSKKLKLDIQATQTKNFLDVLKLEVEYGTYKEIFQKFGFIRRTDEFPESTKELRFTFDVFVPQSNVKKAEMFPSYQVVVVKSTDNFPTNAELELLRRKQRSKVPVMIAIVSESMTTHFCICTF